MHDRHHVVFFDAYPHVYGGAQRITQLLARELGRGGGVVEVALPADGPFADRLRADGIKTEVIPAPPALRRYGHTTRPWPALVELSAYWRELTRQWRGRVDVVHVNDHRGITLAGVPARRAGAAVVWHVHAAERAPALTAFGALLAHRVVIPSRAAIHRMPVLRAARPVVVPNGLPFDEASTPSAMPRGAVVVAVGRLHPDKGFDLLVEAAPRLRARVPGARIVIVGGTQDGHEQYAAALDAARRAPRCDGIVEVTGFVDDPAPYLASARVHVQPSRRDSFPLAVLEAMGAGLPVVASRVDGLRELVVHERTGLLVEPEDPIALADALAALLEDPARAERLGRAGRDRARALFSLDRMVDAVRAVHRDAIARRASGRAARRTTRAT